MRTSIFRLLLRAHSPFFDTSVLIVITISHVFSFFFFFFAGVKTLLKFHQVLKRKQKKEKKKGSETKRVSFAFSQSEKTHIYAK